jgi:Glutamate synthase domain 2
VRLALENGLRKILSKMRDFSARPAITALMFFEAIGLGDDVIDLCFLQHH